jgi:phage-related protein
MGSVEILNAVRAFRKKTQKTPRREIELALKRAKEVG